MAEMKRTLSLHQMTKQRNLRGRRVSPPSKLIVIKDHHQYVLDIRNMMAMNIERTACDEGEESQNLVLFEHEAACRGDAPIPLPSGKQVFLTSLVNLDDTSKWTSKKVETCIERAVVAVSHKIASYDRFTMICCAPESGRSTRYIPMKPGFFPHFANVLTAGFGIDDTVMNKTSLISTITSTTRNFLNRMRKKKQQVVDHLLAEFREEMHLLFESHLFFMKNNRVDDAVILRTEIRSCLE
ncbi:unnamed protein product [Caenorhabditis sp. 36 PRJEB53466]|nr:unnamed protein product [Caenorhabditis sp. 36 PRJEB53466]